MIKKLLLVLLVSLFAVGNVNAQKPKMSMKPKKKECLRYIECGHLRGKDVWNCWGIETFIPRWSLQIYSGTSSVSSWIGRKLSVRKSRNKVLCDPFWSLLSVQGYAFCRPIPRQRGTSRTKTYASVGVGKKTEARSLATCTCHLQIIISPNCSCCYHVLQVFLSLSISLLTLSTFGVDP